MADTMIFIEIHSVCTNLQGNGDDPEKSAQNFVALWLNLCHYNNQTWFFIALTFTLKCISIGTPKIINFPFVSNGKLMIFRSPNIQTDYNEVVLCLNFGTP